MATSQSPAQQTIALPPSQQRRLSLKAACGTLLITIYERRQCNDLPALSAELKVRSKQETLGEFSLHFNIERRVRAVYKVYSSRINEPCCPDYQVALAQPQPSYKTPIHIQPGALHSLRGSMRGEHAILKLQLPHMPESAKSELLSASCVLQRESQVCLGYDASAVAWVAAFKVRPFPLDPFKIGMTSWR